MYMNKKRPGEVRDAIINVLTACPTGATLPEIEVGVESLIGRTSPSSVRSYLRLNTPTLFARTDRARYALGDLFETPQAHFQTRVAPPESTTFKHGRVKLVHSECIEWMDYQRANSIHGVVTDPPYGLFEYSAEQQEKLRSGKGGVWRIPPSFDGAKRAPLPRFTVLDAQDHRAIDDFFYRWSISLRRVLVPGANVVVASNPLLSYIVSGAMSRAGLERRGEIARLVMTMRGGDRPKHAHLEFADVSVMPRSMWEPWLVFRKPIDGRVQDNLRKWGTGGFRRPSDERPFGDVIASAPTRASERALAPHPSLKPQAFLRQLVRGVLPLGSGIVYDPFAGSGSTMAATEATGYSGVATEKDVEYFEVAKLAIPRLAALAVA